MLKEFNRTALESDPPPINLLIKDNHNIGIENGLIDIDVNIQLLNEDLKKRVPTSPLKQMSLFLYLGARSYREIIVDEFKNMGYSQDDAEFAADFIDKMKGTLIGTYSDKSGSEFLYINTPYLYNHSKQNGTMTREQIVATKIAETWLHESVHILQSLTVEGKEQMHRDGANNFYFMIGGAASNILFFTLIGLPRHKNDANMQRRFTRRDFLKLAGWVAVGLVTAPLGGNLGKATYYYLLNETEQQTRDAAKIGVTEIAKAFTIVKK